ncbi:2-dehydropantoate 2-reductase [Fictibacillus sp. UD]|uniref:ketopantoate reductase family protein n=1 Tax=Fictibacillus sp. UD TaxID=3038777 RepID=UPI0037460113
MKVSIIGGGAIGLLVAYFLKINRKEPVIYTRSAEQAEELVKFGLTYKNLQGVKSNVRVEAKPIEEFSGNEPVCIISVKQTAIKDLKWLEDYKEISYLFLQNGISHLSFIDKLPHKQVCVGVVEHGAVKENHSTVHHLGEGRIKLASYRGDSHYEWKSLLNSNTSPVNLEEEWETMVYEKLIMNASINPLSAILRITNGELLTNEHAFSIMKKLYEEAVTVLNLIDRREDLWKELLILCRNTSLNRSSMLKSVESGQQTEIDSITGEIIKRGISLKIDTPYSRFVYEAVKALDWRG